jgi:Immunity protein 53
MDLLLWLQDWYLSQCNGDWEHRSGIDIETLDNSGWRVSIALEDTTASRATMPPLEQNHGDDDWIFCRVENGSSKAVVIPGS